MIDHDSMIVCKSSKTIFLWNKPKKNCYIFGKSHDCMYKSSKRAIERHPAAFITNDTISDLTALWVKIRFLVNESPKFSWPYKQPAGLHIKWGWFILRIFPYPHIFLIAMAQNDRTQTHGYSNPSPYVCTLPFCRSLIANPTICWTILVMMLIICHEVVVIMGHPNLPTYIVPDPKLRAIKLQY